MVTYLRRNVTIVRGASYHLLGSRISRDSKIRFRLQVGYVSRHNAMAMTLAHTNEAVRRENHAEKNLYKEKN